MANNYEGEIDITLDHKTYPMKVNMRVIAAFQTETGEDFMKVAIRSMNALRRSTNYDEPLDQAEIMTRAVTLEHAATLFYLAAKEKDRAVTFEEMQEAVLMEGPLAQKGDDGEVIQSYPILFAQLMMFSVLGVGEEAKKE